MEYIVYVAVVAGLLFMCACALRGVRKQELYQKPVTESDDKFNKNENELRLRALNNVPTPWGWPGSELNGHHAQANGAAHNGNQGIHRWVDGLVSEKQTTENAEYRRKREASLRALLEDRFHNSSRVSEIEYRKTKPPRLRDPSAPHDQMDNFPSGRLNKIESKLAHVNGDAAVRPIHIAPTGQESLSGVRTPWGW